MKRNKEQRERLEAMVSKNNTKPNVLCSGVHEINRNRKEKCQNRESCTAYIGYEKLHKTTGGQGYYSVEYCYVSNFRKCEIYKQR